MAKRHPLYYRWKNMRARCNNPRLPSYRYYGAKGVMVCSRWDDFSVFAADVGPCPTPGWTLDRIDSAGHYEPTNVRWASRTTQARNRPTWVKLDPEKVTEIRQTYLGDMRQKGARGRFVSSGGITLTSLAAKFNTSHQVIRRIVNRKNWADV
jgi:hypothetical protein